ncbi:uncharacterized protein LOC107793459 isoform X1 [Nicotiana tabacum]|uniref:Uncharacterized protein LOC107793459 isoform X1 n=1 Tax=Nicotiana tabacum TaxID=4097 RepID=A0A1S4A3Q5_TOBAC|nr:PREDICTED: uncharacterized protein LOC107793459 isoform X1 [Nicotiana tabacum]
MELKCTFNVIFFLVLLLLVAPSVSSSSGKMELSNVESGIYDIDYRGPETHTNIPPPRGGRHNSHHQTGILFHHKSKGLRTTRPGKTVRRGRKIMDEGVKV